MVTFLEHDIDTGKLSHQKLGTTYLRRPEHYYNENIASVLPWIANLILQTIQACNGLMTVFGQVIQLPPDIAPGYRVYVRGPHNEDVAEILKVHSGGSPWWTAEHSVVEEKT